MPDRPPRRPRAPHQQQHPAGVEDLLRQLVAGQAAQGEQLTNLSERLNEAAAIASTARDLATRTNTILEEQNLVARFGDHRREIRDMITEIRQDFVAANTSLRNDVAKLEGRIKALEDERQRREGIKSFAEWLMKHAPWLFAGIAAFLAGLGAKGGLK